MTDGPSQPELPTAFEMVETVVLLITGGVVGAPMLPGFLLCVPALVAVTVVLVAPLVVAAALVTLVGAVVAIPFLLVRSIGSLRWRRAAPAAVRLGPRHVSG